MNPQHLSLAIYDGSVAISYVWLETLASVALSKLHLHMPAAKQRATSFKCSEIRNLASTPRAHLTGRLRQNSRSVSGLSEVSVRNDSGCRMADVQQRRREAFEVEVLSSRRPSTLKQLRAESTQRGRATWRFISDLRRPHGSFLQHGAVEPRLAFNDAAIGTLVTMVGNGLSGCSTSRAPNSPLLASPRAFLVDAVDQVSAIVLLAAEQKKLTLSRRLSYSNLRVMQDASTSRLQPSGAALKVENASRSPSKDCRSNPQQIG